MDLLDGMKKKCYKENDKGANYYNTTYNANLDLFSRLSRNNDEDEIIRLFKNALNEDENIALANLLYVLDIKEGKGERRLFKIMFKELCLNYPTFALKIIPLIGKIGRYDYILVGIDTPVEDNVIELIKKQLEDDQNSDNPSLLAKWLPSHRTHGKNSVLAKKIMKKLNLKEKDYRKLLSILRGKINVLEKNLTSKSYEKIDFSCVPTKAMLKYRNAFNRHMKYQYNKYKNRVRTGEDKINTSGLFAYEIIKSVLWNMSYDDDIYDLMWNNQKDIFKNNKSNVLVVADTSGSMRSYNDIPLATSIGLALYTAERNNGIFKNHFITFSSRPTLEEVRGKTIADKVRNIEYIVDNTDIDKVFELILDVAVSNNIKEEDMPSHILLISDMQFDKGVYTKNGTNFDGWKEAFKEKGYKLPIIIFWNVAMNISGVPVTKFDNDVALISGFSTNLLENILTLDNYNISNVMLEKLKPYIKMLNY